MYPDRIMDIKTLVKNDLIRVIRKTMPASLRTRIVLKVRKMASKPVSVVRKTRKPKMEDLWKHTPLYKVLCQYQHELETDEKCQISRFFKRRYRMSYASFTAFIHELRQCIAFGDLESMPDATGKFGPPFELKVLGTLRFLGRGSPLDDICEVIGISAELMRRFIESFCEKLVEHFYDKLIDVYRDGPQMSRPDASVTTYGSLFPGCIGSIDSTHVAWGNCPAMLRNSLTGKYSCPTLIFSVACDHNRRVLSCSRGYGGLNNDKTICKYDLFVKRLLNDSRFCNFEYSLQSQEGPVVCRGCYLLSDGGYLHSPIFQMPTVFPTKDPEISLSELIESYRKDVECLFGILKKRFRILKNDILTRNREHVSNIFLSCCIIHNYLLERNDAYKSKLVNVRNWQQLGLSEREDLDSSSDSDEGVATTEPRVSNRVHSERNRIIPEHNQPPECRVVDEDSRIKLQDYDGWFPVREKIRVHVSLVRGQNGNNF